MKALWALEAARPAGSGTSVREIRARVAADHRPLAYTTVETIMDRLTRKGAVARRKQGKAHRYTVLYQRSAARAQGVAALVKHFFDGSRRALHAYLAGQPIVERAPLRRTAPPFQKSGRQLDVWIPTEQVVDGAGAAAATADDSRCQLFFARSTH
ncbi:MAG: BlaI/MecI/CopY family transcriptional regulator, partial [Candidatus Acidiferrales bacterium]